MGIEEEVEKLLVVAKETGSAFLGRFTPAQLESAGFVTDDEDDSYKYVDIFVLYDGLFKLKYVFDDDEKSTETDTENDFYGYDMFKYAVKLYLEAKKQ